MKVTGSLELGSPRSLRENMKCSRERTCLSLGSRLDVCMCHCTCACVCDRVCDSVHVHSDPNITIMHCYNKQ